jgi:hypothetical protein
VPTLDSTALAALLISALLLSWLLVVRKRGGSGSKKAADSSLDTLQAWPPQAVRVMTLPERRAYDVLRKALPGRLILAQVPLARFISVPTRNSYSDWLTRVGRLSVDLLVCDHSSRVIAAIDIRSADESSRARQRHQRMAEVLRVAGIAVHSWNADALPSITDARSLFLPAGADTGQESVLPAMTPGGKPILPVPEIQEMLAPGDEAAAATPQFDPVSSAYFDDLDAIASARTGRH